MEATNQKTKFSLDFLQKLGFSQEEAALYITLVKEGALTILEAARASSIERTKLYRIVDSLTKRGLIEEIPEFNRRRIKATDGPVIDMLIKEREIQNKVLANSFPLFLQTVESLKKNSSENRVVYYRGVEGIKQMTWNILSCKGLYRTYSYRFWEDLLGPAFVLKFNARMIEANLKVHDIYSDDYLEYKADWIKHNKPKPVGDWMNWDSRYISKEIINVNQNIDIYNDVVAYYYWQGDETFGVEIYNQRIADLQKQIHDVLWKMGKNRPELDWSQPWK